MRLPIILLAALLFSMLSACAKLTVEYPILQEMPQAKADSALVFFFKRDPGYRQARKYYVYDDGELLGAVKDGTFFFVRLVPGKHNFHCLTIGLHSGLTYYLVVGDGQVYEVDKKLEIYSARNCTSVFAPISQEKAQPIIANLTYTIISRR